MTEICVKCGFAYTTITSAAPQESCPACRAVIGDQHYHDCDAAGCFGLTVDVTRAPAKAMQFMTRAEAAAMARAIHWRTTDATEIEVMGFRLWAIADDHMNYVASVRKRTKQ